MSVRRGLSRNLPENETPSAPQLRVQLIDELLKKPENYRIVQPTKEWRKNMRMMRLPGQLPPVEILFAASFIYNVKFLVYYWSGAPIVFWDRRIQGMHTISLQCLGGIHYNLLTGKCKNTVSRDYYYSDPRSPTVKTKQTVIAPKSGVELTPKNSCDCSASVHPRIPLRLRGQPMCGILDTGAEVSLVRKSVLQACQGEDGFKVDLEQQILIQGFTGCISSVSGTVKLTVQLPGGLAAEEHTFAVVDDELIPHCLLLGFDFMHSNKLAIDGSSWEVVQKIHKEKRFPLTYIRTSIIHNNAKLTTASNRPHLEQLHRPTRMINQHRTSPRVSQ